MRQLVIMLEAAGEKRGWDLSCGSRISQPPTKPDIEERHQKRDHGRRVVTHVRAGGRARNGHCCAQANSSMLLTTVLESAPVRTIDRPRALVANRNLETPAMQR